MGQTGPEQESETWRARTWAAAVSSSVSPMSGWEWSTGSAASPLYHSRLTLSLGTASLSRIRSPCTPQRAPRVKAEVSRGAGAAAHSTLTQCGRATAGS